MPVTIVFLPFMILSEMECKGAIFWETKKVFHIFFKKKSHSVIQFCFKMDKKRHKTLNFADFQWFRCPLLFYV